MAAVAAGPVAAVVQAAAAEAEAEAEALPRTDRQKSSVPAEREPQP